MAKEDKYWNNPVDDLSIDWGVGDAEKTNGKPLSGRAVQDTIKNTFDKKVGYVGYYEKIRKYIMTKDEDSFSSYRDLMENGEIEEAKKYNLGEFNAPFEHSISVSFTNPKNGYMTILKGTKGVELSFYFTTKNSQGNIEPEYYNYKITSTQSNGVQRTKNGYTKDKQNTNVTFNIDDLLSDGVNNITVTATGQMSGVSGFATAVVKVIVLNVSDKFDISTKYTFRDTESETINVRHTVETNSRTIVKWYIDNEYKGDTTFNSGGEGRFTYVIKKGDLTNGVHTIKYFAEYADGDTAEPFVTPIYCRNFFVVDTDYIIGKLPLFSMSFELPYAEEYLTGSVKPTFQNIKQYDTITIPFAIHADGECVVNIEIAEGGKDTFKTYSTVIAESNKVINQKIVIKEKGNAYIRFSSEGVEPINIGPFEVLQNDLIQAPDDDNLLLYLNAEGRINKDEKVSVWEYGDYKVKFSDNFQWNSMNGWNDDKLIITNGTFVEIPFKPFADSKLYNDGYTLEFEFSTKNIYDENGVICRIMDENTDDNPAGIELTASEAIFHINSNTKVSTKFKSGQTYRVSFVKTYTGSNEEEYKNSRFVKLYVNGVLCGIEEFKFNTNFTNNSIIKFQGTEKAEVELRNIRIIGEALDDDEILNNYMFYRTNSVEKTELYTNNNIVNGNFLNIEAIKQYLPVMIIKQRTAEHKIENLELEFSDKKKTIYVDIDYTDVNNPEHNFKIEHATLTPQGTSSMKYPKKNYRFYTQKHDKTKLFVGEFKNQERTGKDRKFSFKDDAPEVKCWCLKADFAESSGTHNTGVARYWNKVLTEAKLYTNAQRVAIEENYDSDVRTTIDGFPIVLFYETMNGDMRFLGKYNFNNDKSSEDVFGFTGGDKVETRVIRYLPIGTNKPIIQNEEKTVDGITTLVPKAEILYSDGYFKEDGIIRSAADIFEKPSKKSPLYYYEGVEGDNGGKMYYMLQTQDMFDNPRMECWEILSSGSKLALFTQVMTGIKEKDFDKDNEKIGYYDETNAFQESFESRFPDCGDYFNTYNLQRFIKWLNDCQYLKTEVDENKIAKLVPMSQEELEALEGYSPKLTIQLLSRVNKDRFKFAFNRDIEYQPIDYDRIKDELENYDNMSSFEGYRYVVGMTDELAKDYVCIEVEGDDLPTVKNDMVDLIKFKGYYYYWGYYKVYYTMELPTENIGEGMYVCLFNELSSENKNKGYYAWKDFREFSEFTELKEYDNTPENRALKFAVEKYDHFRMDMLAAYYIYLMRFGGVDQTVKNAMLTTEGSDDNTNINLPSKWYFINYDNDTILGVKNDGRLVFDPYIDRNTIEVTTLDKEGNEVHAFCYAGKNSVMWNNFEYDKDFMDYVPTIDEELQKSAAGLSYENAINMFNKEQAGKWCERIYNWDAKVKYIETFTNRSSNMENDKNATFDYLLNVQGPRSAHREWWLSKRFNIFDSYYTTGSFKNDVVTFKCNGPSKNNDTAEITSGEDIYYGYYKNNPESAFKTSTTIKPGDTWTLTVTADSTIGDPHAIFGAPNIKKMDLRGISHRLTELQMQGIRNSTIGTKLTELLIGNHEQPRLNESFDVFGGTDNMEKLEILDVTGCKNLPNIHNGSNMKELYCAGTKVDSISFKGSNITKMELPINLESLTLNECPNITWDDIKFFELDDSGIKREAVNFSKQRNLTAIEIVDSPKLLSNHDIILTWVNTRKEQGWNLSNCRLKLDKINWTLNADEIEKLYVLGEIGTPVEDTIKGKINISKNLTLEEVTKLTDIFGDNCFDKGANLEIIAGQGVYISAISDDGKNITEGELAKKYKCIVIGSNGKVDPNDWILNFSEINESGAAGPIGEGIEYSEKVDDKLQCSIKIDELYRTVSYIRIQASYRLTLESGDYDYVESEPYDIKVHKLTYPTLGEIEALDGNVIAKENEPFEFVLNFTDENGNTTFNGNYRTVWNIIGTDKVTKDQTSTTKCILKAIDLSNTTFTLEAKIYRTIQGDEINFLTISTLVYLQNPNVILIREQNPALFKLLFDNGFTNEEEEFTTDMANKITSNSWCSDNKKQFKDIFKGYTGYTDGYNTYEFEDFSCLKNLRRIISITPSMFEGCSKLKNITLSGISSIEKKAFKGCSSLNNVILSTSLMTILDEAFNDCDKLTEITIPNSVTTLGADAFSSCGELQKVVLGENITVLNSRVFKDCKKLTEVEFVGNITEIKNNAFEGCTALRTLEIQNSIENIEFTSGATPFMYCSLLSFEGEGNEKYFVDENGSLYFNDIENEKIWLLKQNPNCEISRNNTLYAAAYSLCGMKISDIVIPHNLIYAGLNIMYGSTGKSVKLERQFKNADNGLCQGFFSKTNYNSYEFAAGETTIPEGCFSGSTFTSFTIPEQITTISKDAFFDCDLLTSIIIPKNVEIIGENAFNNMKALRYIYFKSQTPPKREDVNGKQYNIILDINTPTVYVLPDSLDVYKKQWDDYKEYMEMEYLPSKGWFRIISGDTIYWGNDVTIGNGIKATILDNGYYEFTTQGEVYNKDIKISGTKIGIFTENYCDKFVNCSLNLYEGNGVDFTREIYDNSIVTDSSWVYSEKLQALKSNAVKGNTTSSVTLNLKEYAENGYVYIICGQMSESKYDYVVIKDQDDKLIEFEIIECKGQPSMIGVRKTTAISESDKFYQFRYVTSNYIKIKLPIRDSYTFSYSKDGSNDYYVDAFWIKTVGTPIFKEPELGEGKVETFTITSNQNIKIPSNVKVTITNNTHFKAEYIFNENNQITVSLPKNDEYTITSEDFMIGNKLYLAFNSQIVNTSNEVNDLTLNYNTLNGQNVLMSDFSYKKYDATVNINDILLYIYSDDDNDYYITKNYESNVWSNSQVNDSEMYTSIIGNGTLYSTEEHTEGYLNTNNLINILGSSGIAVTKAKNYSYLTEHIKYEWFIPSVEELSTVRYNFRNALPLTDSKWWTSNIKDANTVYTIDSNGTYSEEDRTNNNTIIIFGRRSYDN